MAIHTCETGCGRDGSIAFGAEFEDMTERSTLCYPCLFNEAGWSMFAASLPGDWTDELKEVVLNQYASDLNASLCALVEKTSADLTERLMGPS